MANSTGLGLGIRSDARIGSSPVEAMVIFPQGDCGAVNQTVFLCEYPRVFALNRAKQLWWGRGLPGNVELSIFGGATVRCGDAGCGHANDRSFADEPGWGGVVVNNRVILFAFTSWRTVGIPSFSGL